MKNTPFVSIIITTKNEERNIERLLESITSQTYKNIETIVVDNKSTDKTKDLAKKYTKKVFDQGPERSAQRNFGAIKARGKYLFILDADMELSPKVLESCVSHIKSSKHKALIIPERTVGEGFMSKIRSFEREMYVGDPTVEVARFFDKKVFNEFHGYDESLTGAEDYDLPYRMGKKYSIGWVEEWILHHEETITLGSQLRKKYYYAKRSAKYAQKHPELVSTQGNMLFRKAYFRNWRKFLKHPVLGTSFVVIRFLEASSAILGYISAVGIVVFMKTFTDMLRKQ